MDDQCLFQDLFATPLKNGVSYSARNRGKGTPMVNMREIFAFDRITDQECERVPLTERERDAYLLSCHDLLFARQSLTHEGAGKCVLVLSSPEERTWESHLIRVRLDPTKGWAPYYYYYFRSPSGRRLMETIIQQVAAAGIRGSDLSQLRVPKPPVIQQRAIAEVLGGLDDKIAANDCIASTAKALLATQFAKLRIDVATQDSHTMALSELIELNPRLPSPTVAEPVYLDMKSLPNEAMTMTSWGYRVSRGGARFQNGDTLLARITPCLENGKVGFVDFLGEDEVGIGSTEYIVLRARNSVPRVLPYFLAASPRFREFAIRHMVGTSGRQRLAASDLSDFRVQRPDPYELAEFARVSGSLMPRVKASVDESRALAAARDELLPLLISGKVRVRDAEKVVEEVT